MPSTPPRPARIGAPVLAFACALATLVFAAPAMAGTASFDNVTGVVSFTDGAAEDNAVTFSDGGGGLVEVSDANQPVVLGDNCVQDADGVSALCGDGILAPTQLTATLGDGTDSASTSLSGIPVNFDGGAGDDTLSGGDQADTLTGGTGSDTLSGGDGPDQLNGGDDGDTLNGDAGADTLNGDGGNDQLNGGADDDQLNGGAGNDTLDGGTGADSIDGNSDEDTVTYASRTNGVSVSLDGAANDGEPGEADNVVGVEDMIGGSGNDTITGDDGPNVINGGDGDDQLFGQGGADTINGGIGADTIDGGTGTDTMDGGDGEDQLSYAGRSASVSVTFNGVADDGGPGEGDSAVNFEDIAGGSGDDTLTGDDASNVIAGNGGDDTISGAGGNDVLQGGDGADDLSGGAGNDTLDGGTGNDTLAGGTGADDIAGGAGDDLVDYSDHTSGVAVDLDGAAGDDGSDDDGPAGARDTVHNDVEDIAGTPYNDLLGGSTAPNFIDGAGGNDYIAGDDGDDTLLGGDGNDTIAGGDGNDAIHGGIGDDLLDGGTGTDQLNGDGGTDFVTYASRTDPITASLDGLANDGAFGENDAISSDIEGLIGGQGNDVLDGNAQSNYLDGQGGKDTITGGSGVDTLLGGADDDTIVARDGFIDNIACGDGNDSVTADATENYVAGCETIDTGVSSGGGGGGGGGGGAIGGGALPGAGGDDASSSAIDWNSFIANLVAGNQVGTVNFGSLQDIINAVSSSNAGTSANAITAAVQAAAASTAGRSTAGQPRSHPRGLTATTKTVRVLSLPATVIVTGKMNPATKVGKTACGLGYVQAKIKPQKGKELVTKAALGKSCEYRLVIRLAKGTKLRKATKVEIRFMGNGYQLPFTLKPSLSLRVG